MEPKEVKEQIKAVELGLTDNPERRHVDLGKPDTRIKCACGKPVEEDGPQADQCLECFNRK
jgi:hypothetical protein